MKKVLIVFALEPIPGYVKSRLAASVGDRAAAELYETMLQVVFKTASQLIGIGTIVYWASEEETLLLLGDKYRCRSRRQSLGNLGERMQRAFEEMFAEGYDA